MCVRESESEEVCYLQEHLSALREETVGDLVHGGYLHGRESEREKIEVAKVNEYRRVQISRGLFPLAKEERTEDGAEVLLSAPSLLLR